MRSRISSIENLISKDPSGRRIFSLVQRDHLRLAALSLQRAERVLIASGFPIMKAGAGETDGPPGALALGKALRALGIPVAFLSDRINAPLFQSLEAAPLLEWKQNLLDVESFSHLVAVECPGRARDGHYYNMLGERITTHIEPLDSIFQEAESRGLVTVGIGDGGNEIGMGRIFQNVHQTVFHGRRIASILLTDYVIVAGVSNWGAYGLVGALSVLHGKDLLPSVEDMIHSLEALVKAGAVDGVSGRTELSVDGLSIAYHTDLLQEIRRHVLPSPLDRVKDLTAGVLGIGRTGCAVARLLRHHGARVRLSDHRTVTIPPDLKDLPAETGEHTLRFLAETELFVVSPGVPPSLPLIHALRERDIPVMSELEVAYQLGLPNLIAVTGSRGKRSTVQLTGRLLALCGQFTCVGGNKGTPLSQMLVSKSRNNWIVLAVSSFQLESIVHFRPRIAIILNVGGQHVDRHHDVRETVRIKSRIFMNQGAEDYLILSRDDRRLSSLPQKHWGETLFVSSHSRLTQGVSVRRGRIILSLDGHNHDVGEAPERFPENLLSAILASSLIGASPDQLREAVAMQAADNTH